jgi:HSP20 family protein
MREEMDRIWDRFSKESSTSAPESEWNPSLDLRETENSLVAEIEVPGIHPDDIQISVTPDTVTIAGEKKQQNQAKSKNCHIRERAYGTFNRTIKLPTAVNPDRVEARYKDGILHIFLRKSETAKRKRIEVETR